MDITEKDAKLAKLDYVMAQFGQHGGWLHRVLKDRICDGWELAWFVDSHVKNAALRRSLRPLMDVVERAARWKENKTDATVASFVEATTALTLHQALYGQGFTVHTVYDRSTHCWCLRVPAVEFNQARRVLGCE
ncbi:MAG: hypothetical protein ACYCYO_01440 [Bacilli bacterium]